MSLRDLLVFFFAPFWKKSRKKNQKCYRLFFFFYSISFDEDKLAMLAMQVSDRTLTTPIAARLTLDCSNNVR